MTKKDALLSVSRYAEKHKYYWEIYYTAFSKTWTANLDVRHCELQCVGKSHKKALKKLVREIMAYERSRLNEPGETSDDY